ncbi:OmpA family protein [Gelidibacter mesophilus]|uniref:OmpA family protein n=1 Tax=Gelidibacter mesophilus TaxID=169050 RepID=UPI000A061E75|nr:OmpA family protein [Gelidibacter mesophilus]
MKFKISFMMLLISALSYSQIGRTYPDGHGDRVFFPYGDISFADEVVSFKIGDPGPIEGFGPEEALGIPNYEGNPNKYFATLGYGGELVVRFTDNVLYDIPGPDLFILEIGALTEPVDAYISKDGKDWISVGRTDGGFSALDIADYVEKSDVFRYVKVVDIKAKKGGKWPGADIDAIGAIGSSINFQLNAAVTFDTGKAKLKENTSELADIAKKIKDLKGLVLIEGYTDNIGSTESNITLSKNRADAVKNFLVDNAKIDAKNITTKALGESNPVADNATEEGRQKNRRVELIVFQNTEIEQKNVTGTWKTTKNGNLRIYRYGDVIAGWYENDGGEILGKMSDDHTMQGQWIENKSGKTCNTAIYDRKNWGSLVLEFNEDFTEFKGQWGYCDAEASTTGWDANRN